MIVKGLLELVFGLLQIVFAPINLPDLPEGIANVLDELIDVLAGAVGLFGIFVDLTVVRWLIPVVLIIVNFDKIWNVIMFILRKIPFLGIE
jgi:hypothetical protein